MSIILNIDNAYQNLFHGVIPGGKIIIGDMKLATGWKKVFNPMTIRLAKRYGGSHEGHQNSLTLISKMKSDLEDICCDEFFLGSYFYCIG